MGTNHDEGRTFTQGFASYTRRQYVQFVNQTYGPQAPAILRHYPWGAYPAPYTASNAIGGDLDRQRIRHRPTGAPSARAGS